MNFRGADLRGADIGDSYFFEADLSGAKLNQVEANRAYMVTTNLRRANLSGAHILDVDFGASDLSFANLTRAEVSGSIFNDTDLDGTDFAKARVGLNHFGAVDLSRAKGLDTVIHEYPSNIGISAIYSSKASIPLIFLRGCGVPEDFITYMSSLVGTGIEYYSLFISYSTQDRNFAQRLYSDLQVHGIRCWFAPRDLKGGRKTYGQIDEAIRSYDRLLLVLSPASMNSEWVRTEIALARKKELEQNKAILFPVSLCPFSELRAWEYFDSDVGKDSAREIREYHIPDFTNWTDHAAYEKAFSRLISDLRGKP